MSLYSDYYAPEVERGAVNNMEVITWDASWGPADTGEVDMGGNMVYIIRHLILELMFSQ